MANMTERNGLGLLLLVSCQSSLNAYIFSFLFFFFSLNLFCYVFVLFCSVFFFFNFPTWYQFNFVSFSCWKFNFTYFSHNYDNYAMLRDVPKCSGMFRNVPCYCFYRRPAKTAFLTNLQTLNFTLKKSRWNFEIFFSKLVHRKGCFGKIKKNRLRSLKFAS